MIWTPDRASALARLDAFVPHGARAYAATRNDDDGEARTNVSQLSPWLHAGLLSEEEVLRSVLAQHSPSAAEKFVSEVFWRIYFKGYLEHHPTIWTAYQEQRDHALDQVAANSGLATAFGKATQGRTGIAAFDHWAGELVRTGYLHNHARMWFASIWIFTLKLDWTLGADFFLRHLLDGDAASNTLSWRWVGGLHTKGKTYLARADNIARYTAGHPDGPLAAEGLVNHAEALHEAHDHARLPLSLPPQPLPLDFAEPYALVLHDEGAGHVPLDLPRPPALVIGAARPDARSPAATGAPARAFAQGAVSNGAAQAARELGCPHTDWTAEKPLAEILSAAGLDRIACAYLPTGWTRDALWPQLAPLAQSGALITLLAPTSRLTWPHAKAGFFGVKKQSGAVLAAIG